MNSYPQLVGVRICLGVAEAGFFPGVVYLSAFILHVYFDLNTKTLLFSV